jgi:acyl-coenzyme A thioesterase PaaI-like protein
MPESLRSRLERFAFNFFPAYFGTGARITFISSDWREVRVSVPLSLRTRNYVGVIFGGSIYGAVDPIYMLMLMKNLGRAYVVWDRAATVRFLRPGRSTLRARFELPLEELDAIRQALAHRRSLDRHYTIRLVDEDGVVCAEVEKTIYVRRADAARPPERAGPEAPPARAPEARRAPPARRRGRPAPRPPPRGRPGRRRR